MLQLSVPAHLAGLDDDAPFPAHRALQQQLANLSSAHDMLRGLYASVDRLARSSRAADFAALEAALRGAVAAPDDVRCRLAAYA